MTKEFKIEIDTVCFNAVRKFVAPFATDSKKESYCYMHLEIGSKKGLLVAHDGVAMLCHIFDVDLPDVTELISVNIKKDFVQEDAAAKVTTITDKDTAEFSDYVNWRRVFPQYLSNITSHFNPKYLLKIETAGALLVPDAASSIVLTHNGEQQVLFKYAGRDDFIGLLKPLSKMPEPLYKIPEWVNQPLELAEDFSDLI